ELMFKRYLPIFNWLPHYHQRLLGGRPSGRLDRDRHGHSSVVGVCTAGRSASGRGGYMRAFCPQLLYTLLGTSRTLAVGPVAIIALMTGAALSSVAAPGSAEYVQAALVLSLLSGAMLMAMGALKMGFLATF
ncbi:sulfate:proton symporter, partial [Halomonas sp. SUBG004]